ncbi:MAG: hypothetical protein AAF547_07825 [Actinomycetota bacterium]
MTATLYRPGSQLAGIPHLSALLVGVATSVVVGRPFGWIGFLLPLGPLACVAVARLLGRSAEPTWRLAFGFSLVCALLIGGGWSLMQAGGSVAPLTLIFPFALLAFLLGLVNFVLVCVSRAIRAWRSVPLQYPWVPGWLDRPLGLTPTLKEM